MKCKFIVISVLSFIILLACSDDDCDSLSGKWSRVGDIYVSADVDNEYHNEGVTFKIGESVFWCVGDLLYRVSGESNISNALDKFPGTARKGAVAFVIGEKAYVGLGYSEEEGERVYHDDFWVFNGKTYKWEIEPLLYQFPGGARGNAVAFTLEGRGYVGTGQYAGETLRDFYTFDPETGWHEFESLKHSFYGGVAFVAGGCAYVCTGGKDLDVLSSKTYDLFVGMYKLTLATGKWETLDRIDGEGGMFDGTRIHASCFVLKHGGREYAYVVSGLNQYGMAIANCMRYDPRKDKWQEVAYLPEPTVGGSAFSIDGKGYVMVDQRRGFNNTLWEFQP